MKFLLMILCYMALFMFKIEDVYFMYQVLYMSNRLEISKYVLLREKRKKRIRDLKNLDVN